MKAKLINTPRQSKANITKLKSALSEGIVTFEFQKKDLSRRRVVATTNLNHIPIEFHPKGATRKDGSERKQSENTIAVFDLQKGSWISLLKTNITEIYC